MKTYIDFITEAKKAKAKRKAKKAKGKNPVVKSKKQEPLKPVKLGAEKKVPFVSNAVGGGEAKVKKTDPNVEYHAVLEPDYDDFKGQSACIEMAKKKNKFTYANPKCKKLRDMRGDEQKLSYLTSCRTGLFHGSFDAFYAKYENEVFNRTTGIFVDMENLDTNI